MSKDVLKMKETIYLLKETNSTCNLYCISNKTTDYRRV